MFGLCCRECLDVMAQDIDFTIHCDYEDGRHLIKISAFIL